MELKEFELAFNKGLGRCIIAVKENPTKYRDFLEKNIIKSIPLYLHEQDSVASYIFKMISYYNEDKYFYGIFEKAFRNAKMEEYKDLIYFTDMILIYHNKIYDCTDIIKEKINYIYKYLYNLDEATIGLEYIASAYCKLINELIENKECYIKYCKDIGSLLKNELVFKTEYFINFIIRNDNYFDEIQDMSDFNNDINTFIGKVLSYYDGLICPCGELDDQFLETDYEQFSFILSFTIDDEIKKQYANKYLKATNFDEKIKYLKAFVFCPFPLSFEEIINDCNSYNNELKTIAYKALSRIKDEEVRKFALSKLNTEFYNVFDSFLYNYESEDEPILRKCIINLEIDEKENWENIYNSVIYFMNENYDKNIPIDILPYMYEECKNPCIRFEIAKYMDEFYYLPTDIMDELVYDCYERTSEFAKKTLGLNDA